MSIINITLNSLLNHPDWRGIDPFDVIHYPGGEIQTRLNPERGKYILDVLDCEEFNFDDIGTVNITARMRSAGDVMYLAQVCDILRNMMTDLDIINLSLPYLPYGRADRRFTGNGDTFGLGVFLSLLGDIVREYNISNVCTFDAHPGETKLSGIADLFADMAITNIEPKEQITRAIHNTIRHSQEFFSESGITKNMINVVFPDKGAYTRYTNLVPGLLENNTSLITINKLYCEKKRDPATGKFIGFTVPARNEFLNAPILIIDDICDGGGTFNGIMDELEKNGVHERAYLYVSHGIFSQGISELYMRFERIYTTNSFYGAWNPFTWTNSIVEIV